MIHLLLVLQIKRSQHAVINPAITLVLRTGAGGHGVPPLGSPDGILLLFVLSLPMVLCFSFGSLSNCGKKCFLI